MINTLGDSSAIKSAPEPFVHSRTDWERVDALSEEEIDTAEIPPLTDADFVRSEWRSPVSVNANSDTCA